MKIAQGYEASQALIRAVYTSRVRAEDAFIGAYDWIMPAHENASTWKYALHNNPPADTHLWVVVITFLTSVILGVLAARWLLAFFGSHCIAYAGGAALGSGLATGPVLHNFSCYLATSDRRRGLAWNFFSEQGRRRPWLKFLNGMSIPTHFCMCLILFLSLLYIARDAFSARRRQCSFRAKRFVNLIFATCGFLWVCILEGMDPRPCRNLMNHWLHLCLNQFPSIIIVHIARASIVRQLGHGLRNKDEEEREALYSNGDWRKRKVD